MRALPRLSLLFALLVAHLAPCAAVTAGEVDLSGDYVMRGKGHGPNDSAYLGTCSLKRDQALYRVSCFNQDTRHTYTGKGLLTDDTLAVFIGDTLVGDHNRVFTGEYLVVYRRQADGSLTGTWIHAASNAAGSETLTPKR